MSGSVARNMSGLGKCNGIISKPGTLVTGDPEDGIRRPLLAVMNGFIQAIEHAAHLAAIGMKLRHIGLNLNGLADELNGKPGFTSLVRQHTHQVQACRVRRLWLQYLS